MTTYIYRDARHKHHHREGVEELPARIHAERRDVFVRRVEQVRRDVRKVCVWDVWEVREVRQVGQPDAVDRKSTRLNSSHSGESRMPSSA